MGIDNIIAEVENNEFYGTETAEKNVNVEKKVNKKSMEKGRKIDKKKMVSKEFRKCFLKNFVIMAVTAVCAYFKLMHPIVYIPIEIVCLCIVCVKFGEWNGVMNK